MTKEKSDFYDSLMFLRVINNFMVQGGDLRQARPDTDIQMFVSCDPKLKKKLTKK